jgi:hypothetical protein
MVILLNGIFKLGFLHPKNHPTKNRNTKESEQKEASESSILVASLFSCVRTSELIDSLYLYIGVACTHWFPF